MKTAITRNRWKGKQGQKSQVLHAMERLFRTTTKSNNHVVNPKNRKERHLVCYRNCPLKAVPKLGIYINRFVNFLNTPTVREFVWKRHGTEIEMGDKGIKSLIPYYVRMERKKDGMCPKHAKWHHEILELQRIRREIHPKDCNCDRTFCATCKHGTECSGQPGFCPACYDDECPLEKCNTYVRWKDLTFRTTVRPRVDKNGKV
jgi:hypothetical protein